MKFEKLHVDFWAGAYGNFLAFILNKFLFNVPGSDFSPFNQFGASHLGLSDNDLYQRNKVAFACHYSFAHLIPDVLLDNGQTINDSDGILRLQVNTLYPVLYNAHVRAGDTPLDIINLEHNTLEKLIHPKFQGIRNTIISGLGKHDNYNRADLRNLFYSTFLNNDNEVDKFNAWTPIANQTHYFQVDSIYSYHEFVKELGKVSIFVGKRGWDFKHQELYSIWQEFINRNQGYRSYLKCQEIINNILAKNNVDISCDLFEEAYINSYISQTFNVFDGIECFSNQYPTNTSKIYDQIINKVRENRNDI